MRTCWGLAVLVLCASCATDPSSRDAAAPDGWPWVGDACVYASSLCFGEVPPIPTDIVAPTPVCGADGGFETAGTCAHWVECVDGFALTYISGRCEANACVFDSEPTYEYCYAGCRRGTEGRCSRPGPTAP